MSDLIEEFEEINGPAPKAQERGVSYKKQDREPAQFWLNVGVERGGKLLTLPMGIPLDKLEAKKVPNKASEFQQLRIAEQDLWEAFKPVFEALKPGESKRVNFICEIRCINQKEEAEEANPFALGKLSFT